MNNKADLKLKMDQCFAHADWQGTEATEYFTNSKAIQQLFDRREMPFGTDERGSGSVKRAKQAPTKMRRDTIVQVLLALGEKDPVANWDQYVVQAAARVAAPTITPATRSPRRFGLAVAVAIGAFAVIVAVVAGLSKPSEARGTQAGASLTLASDTPIIGREVFVQVRLGAELLARSEHDVRLLVRPSNNMFYVQGAPITAPESSVRAILGESEALAKEEVFQVLLVKFPRGVVPAVNTLPLPPEFLTTNAVQLASLQVTRAR